MRLIEGEFPNYKQVIPKQSEHHLTVSVEPVVRALRRVALLSAEHSRAVKLELGEGKLQLSARTPDLGEAQEELDVDYQGDELGGAGYLRLFTFFGDRIEVRTYSPWLDRFEDNPGDRFELPWAP